MKIKVSFHPGEVDISFRHNWAMLHLGPNDYVREGNAGTEAILKWGDIIYNGKAILSPKDQPSKAIGRKHSLRRALSQAGMSKEARTEIWTGLKEKGMRLE